METCLIYERDKNTGCEYWKERKTGKVFKFRHGKYQKLYDSRGNPVSIENGTDSVKFRYDENNKLSLEYHFFIHPETMQKGEYKKWYKYDEQGNILSIIDSYGNKEFYDENGMPYYSIFGKPVTHTILT